MYIKIYLNDLKYRYDVYQMFNIFYTFKELKFVNEDEERDYDVFISENMVKISDKENSFSYEFKEGYGFKTELKKGIFKFLADTIKDEYPWGTLVGIRPSKIALSLIREGKSDEEIIKYFEDNYMASKEKAKLCIEVAEREESFVNKDEKTISIYVGMPFALLDAFIVPLQQILLRDVKRM